MRSKLEQEVADWLTKHGYKWEYEAYYIDYDLRVRRGHCPECGATDVFARHTYTPDFTIKGKPYVIEAKGRLKSTDRTKLRAVRDGGDEVRLVFRYDNWLYKGADIRYGEWCDKEGFKWCLSKDLSRSFFK